MQLNRAFAAASVFMCVFNATLLSNNIGQIAYLNAQQHGLKRIYFGGGFIRGKVC
jgi:pantothenate kinase